MEGLIVLLVLAVLAVPVLLVIALASVSGLKGRVAALEAQVAALHRRAAAEPTWAPASPSPASEPTPGDLMPQASPPQPQPTPTPAPAVEPAKAAPVMKDALSEHIQATASAISPGTPMRRIGTLARISSPRSALVSFVIGVVM